LVARCILIKKRPEVFQILTPQSDAYYFNTSLALGVVFFFQSSPHRIIWRAELTHTGNAGVGRETLKKYILSCTNRATPFAHLNFNSPFHFLTLNGQNKDVTKMVQNICDVKYETERSRRCTEMSQSKAKWP